MKYSRNDALKELLKTVFGVTTISVTSNNCITYTGKWFSECQFNETTYRRYCSLFKLVLLSDSVQIAEKASKFDKQEAIVNMIQYFEIYNISMLSIFEKIVDKNKFYEWIYKMLKEVLFPAMLISDIKDSSCEDIKEVLEKSFNTIQDALSRFSSSLEQNVELVYDSDCGKEKCNYGINCIGLYSADILDKVMTLHPIMTYFCYPFYAKENSDAYLEFFQEQVLEFDTGLGKLITKEGKSNENYQAFRLRISKKIVEYGSLYNQEYVFATYLDEKQIFAYHCVSPDDLRSIIRNKAKKALRSEIQAKYIIYCQNVFEFVDDVLIRIFSLDFERFIKFDNQKIDYIKEELQKVVINFGQLNLILSDYEEKNYKKQSYYVIQNIILGVIMMLQRQGSIFCKEFKENIHDTKELCKNKLVDID